MPIVKNNYGKSKPKEVTTKKSDTPKPDSKVFKELKNKIKKG